MKIHLGLLLCLLLPLWGVGQPLEAQIEALEGELHALKQREAQLQQELETLKLQKLRTDLRTYGLPALRAGEELIEHTAFFLVYDEAHEQARWVAHIISPEVLKGNVSRTNDFRPDPKISTGSAVEADYFLKYLQPDSTYEYDGFGYDRGHLAPSADFRWSQQALSESYFYSNMSPQRPELNRGKWAELEGMLRQYLQRSPHTQLYVVTGPVLHDSLPRIERSLNGLSIPQQYFKVVLDLNQQRAIGFILPNEACELPIESYAVTVDSVEALTGIDFFPALPDEQESQLESQTDSRLWLPDEQQEDVRPLDPESLPKNCFNTLTARSLAGTGYEVGICGTVVSTRLTRNGHVFINLDKKFPNQIFTVVIWKDNLLNFSYQPHIELQGRKICVEGTIRLSQGTPSMDIQHEKAITFLP